MRGVNIFDRFKVLNADNITDLSRLNNVLQLAEIRCVTKYMADGDDTVFLFRKRENIFAFFPGLGDHFFQQEVVTQFQRLHSRAVMKMVRGCYDGYICKFWTFEDVFPGNKAILSRYAIFPGHPFIFIFDWFSHTDDFPLI